MQRITYINLRGEQAAFGRGGPWLLRSVRGLGTCENELTLTSGGMENGARIQAFRREERRRLVGARAAERHEAIQAQSIVVFLHFIQFRTVVFIRHGHLLEGLALAAEHGAARQKQVLEILFRQRFKIAFDESRIAVEESYNFHVFDMRIGVFCKRPHHCVQSGAIPAARQHSYFHKPFSCVKYARSRRIL